ncbi:hypothetical protein CEF21_08715 [Bacillus sp. FJAT-42376]|nr:hypothetical protein CEF21_08715 [Bacillus sp. FJAT-42376]
MKKIFLKIKTLMRWYRNGEIYRFDQPIGNQNSYGHEPDFTTEEKRMNRQISRLKMENEILIKYLKGSVYTCISERCNGK